MKATAQATHGFHATMTARPGKRDELIELLLSAVAAGGPATNESCLFYIVSRSAGNENVVHVTEGWTTKDAHSANFARDASRALMARISALITDGTQYHDEVPIGGKFPA